MKNVFVLITVVVCCCGANTNSVREVECVPGGDFSDDGQMAARCKCEDGRFSVFTEDATWNRCGRLEISKIRRTEKGEGISSAIIGIGGVPGKAWFDVVPGVNYDFAIELRGNVDEAGIRVIAWRGDEYWKDRSPVDINPGFRHVKVTGDWTAHRGSFRAPAGTRHAALQLTLLRSEEYAQRLFAVGDYLLFDNVRVVESPENRNRIAAGVKVAVAPVPVTSDFATPFLPREVFNPPAAIAVQAAVNELKPLPVAVANLTDRVEDYMVLLECGSQKYQGQFGLSGLSPNKVKAYKALRVRDEDRPVPSCRLDPLVAADGGISVSVPPGEAGLVWFDFDLEGVAPGDYEGRLRVIPLCEPGRFSRIKGSYNNLAYSGEMKVLPVVLKVLPFALPTRAKIPAGFFAPGVSESSMALAKELGAEWFIISPYQFKFGKDADGNLVTTGDSPVVSAVRQNIRNHLDWGRKSGVHPRFFVCYSVVPDFKEFFNPKSDLQIEDRLWPQFLRGIAQVFSDSGVPAEDYALELYDEPKPEVFDEAVRLMRMAKKIVPAMRLGLTLGYHKMSVAQLEELAHFTDLWVVWDAYFNRADYRQFFTAELRRGKDVRHYTCDTSMRISLDGYFRRQAWFGEFYGLTGNMMYQWCEMPGGIGTCDFKAKSNGGLVGFLFGAPVRTLRFMAYREGVTDIKYLSLLEACKDVDPRADALLKSASARVMVEKNYDPSEPERIRAEIVGLLSPGVGARK